MIIHFRDTVHGNVRKEIIRHVLEKEDRNPEGAAALQSSLRAMIALSSRLDVVERSAAGAPGQPSSQSDRTSSSSSATPPDKRTPTPASELHAVPPNKDGSCHLHPNAIGKGKHSFAECRQNPKNASPSSSAGPSAKPPAGAADAAAAAAAHVGAPQPRDLSKVQCHRCRQMGHFATSCPNARVDAPELPAAALRQAPAARRAAVVSSSAISMDRTLPAGVFDDLLVPVAARSATVTPASPTSSSPSMTSPSASWTNATTVELVLDKQLYTAALDSQADVSFIDEALAAKLGLGVSAVLGTIHLADASSKPRSRIGVTPALRVEIPKSLTQAVFLHSFEVMPLRRDGASNCDFILGMDVLRIHFRRGDHLSLPLVSAGPPNLKAAPEQFQAGGDTAAAPPVIPPVALPAPPFSALDAASSALGGGGHAPPASLSVAPTPFSNAEGQTADRAHEDFVPAAAAEVLDTVTAPTPIPSTIFEDAQPLRTRSGPQAVSLRPSTERQGTEAVNDARLNFAARGADFHPSSTATPLARRNFLLFIDAGTRPPPSITGRAVLIAAADAAAHAAVAHPPPEIEINAHALCSIFAAAFRFGPPRIFSAGAAAEFALIVDTRVTARSVVRFQVAPKNACADGTIAVRAAGPPIFSFKKLLHGPDAAAPTLFSDLVRVLLGAALSPHGGIDPLLPSSPRAPRRVPQAWPIMDV